MVYRSEVSLYIPEAREPSPSTLQSEVLIVHTGPADFIGEKVQFTVPVPRTPQVKKSGSG